MTSPPAPSPRASQGPRHAVRHGAEHLIRGAVALHRLLLSPLLGPSCRFVPSCSQYALDAVAVHGPWRGSALAVRRVLRCHPFHAAGFDPVPVADGGRVVCSRGEDASPAARPGGASRRGP